jgi:hypothetical protein
MPDEDESEFDEPSVTRNLGGGSQKGRKLAPQHLKDMRRVYKLPPSDDETSSQKSFRKLKDEDFFKFMGMLQQAERAHDASKLARAKQTGPGAEVKAVESDPDEGTESARIVILRCLAESKR